MNNPFDKLIDKFKGDLPYPIQVGLYYEANRDQEPSRLIKKIEKKLKSKIKKQYNLKRYCDRLHEIPIKQIAKKKLENLDSE